MPIQQWSSFLGPTWALAPVGVSAPVPAGRDANWQKLIDQRLQPWLSDPSQLADDGVEAPSPATIQKAILFAQQSQERGLPPAGSVVTDPNGGIVFERREGAVAEVFHLWDDGTIEYQRFQGATLIERRPL